ncbi:MAG: type II toxin-antitoxin system HicA family toxin [Nanoarchaeota archaeon]|nr:type II toxin-antitoxin system HicA family toxin [Nanoarchaeota archaeon]
MSPIQGKIRPLPRDRVIRILKKNGYVQVKHVKGRHLKMKKYDGGKCMATTMVSHCPTIVPHAIRCIIRQTGKPEHEFY